jgi:two-component sensor histidine kinase
LNQLLLHFERESTNSESISVSAPECLVGEHSTTALAMIVHELATNSAKYGALSAAEGRLDVSCSEGKDQVELVWTERGGPPPKASFGAYGFGSELTARVIKQIGGSITHKWTHAGVIVTLLMNKARLGA